MALTRVTPSVVERLPSLAAQPLHNIDSHGKPAFDRIKAGFLFNPLSLALFITQFCRSRRTVGETGDIHRVAPDGDFRLLFSQQKSRAKHARSSVPMADERRPSDRAA